MDEQKRNNDIEEAASALIKNAEADSVSLGEKLEQMPEKHLKKRPEKKENFLKNIK